MMKRIPLAGTIRTNLRNARRNRSNRRILHRLVRSQHPRAIQISEALTALEGALPPADQDWMDAIEAERTRLLKLEEPLVDGHLGEGGLYDQGVSIKEACAISKKPRKGLLLFLLARATKPVRAIELGTNVGISSAYIAAALKSNGGDARLTTLDASGYRLRLARELHHNLGIHDVSYGEGVFVDTLEPALKDLGSIDLAFIDGHHQYQSTLDYFEAMLPYSRPDTIFVFDDIRWSDGMKRAWAEVRADDRLDLVVDLSSIGVCARRRPASSHRCVLDPMYVL